jgi:hypothetical protein
MIPRAPVTHLPDDVVRRIDARRTSESIVAASRRDEPETLVVDEPRSEGCGTARVYVGDVGVDECKGILSCEQLIHWSLAGELRTNDQSTPLGVLSRRSGESSGREHLCYVRLEVQEPADVIGVGTPPYSSLMMLPMIACPAAN